MLLILGSVRREASSLEGADRLVRVVEDFLEPPHRLHHGAVCRCLGRNRALDQHEPPDPIGMLGRVAVGHVPAEGEPDGIEPPQLERVDEGGGVLVHPRDHSPPLSARAYAG